jgi:hypothetical protein
MLAIYGSISEISPDMSACVYKCAARELTQNRCRGRTRLLAEWLGDLPATGYGDRDEALFETGYTDI